jgi:hypothetical protein
MERESRATSCAAGFWLIGLSLGFRTFFAEVDWLVKGVSLFFPLWVVLS